MNTFDTYVAGKQDVIETRLRDLEAELADLYAENQRLRERCDQQSRKLELYAVRERDRLNRIAA